MFYFERDSEGSFCAPQQYAESALVTANTHDLATLAGFWEGKDLQLRRQTGHISTDEQLRVMESEFERDRQRLLELLKQHGIVSQTWEPSSSSEVCWAVHALLSQTPAALLGIFLDDLMGEEEAVNLPGISDPDRRNWTRRQKMSLEELAKTLSVKQVLSSIGDRVP